METKDCDVLIIGGGPAGLTAGMYAARAGAKVIINENLAAGGQMNLTPDIANFPGYSEIAGYDLAEKMREQAETAGAEIFYCEMQSIDFPSKTVTCLSAIIKYKALIICTGASPRKLGIDREEDFIGHGIHFCALCDGNFYKGKDIIVVGGGNHAVEEAIYMFPIAESITMIVDVEGFSAQEALVKQVKVRNVHYNSKITKILGDKKLSGVEIDVKDWGKTQVTADGIFVAIGRVPNTGIFKDKLELSKQGYIVVNDKMETSIKGVFAAGDVIMKNVRQIITACSDGAVAATAAVESINYLNKEEI